MKLNKECMRELLLAIESLEYMYYFNADDARQEPFDKYEFYEVVYAGEKLIEANYIKGKITHADNDVYNVMFQALTWEGHQFLDNIRDDGVWKKTKSITSKFTSVSVSMLSSIAATVISKMISQELGLK